MFDYVLFEEGGAGFAGPSFLFMVLCLTFGAYCGGREINERTRIGSRCEDKLAQAKLFVIINLIRGAFSVTLLPYKASTFHNLTPLLRKADMLQMFFIVVGASIGGFVLIWALVYALQFIRPDSSLAAYKDANLVRRVQMKAGKRTVVQFRDIRNLERDRVLVGDQEYDYVYHEGNSTGMPEVWLDDLLKRHN